MASTRASVRSTSASVGCESEMGAVIPRCVLCSSESPLDPAVAATGARGLLLVAAAVAHMAAELTVTVLPSDNSLIQLFFKVINLFYLTALFTSTMFISYFSLLLFLLSLSFSELPWMQTRIGKILTI